VKKGKMRRMSVSVGLASAALVVPIGMTAEDLVEVKHGSKRLQVAAGSMAVQVFKVDGKPVENLMYKDMSGWTVSEGFSGSELVIEKSDGETISYKTDQAEELKAKITDQATALAKQMQEEAKRKSLSEGQHEGNDTNGQETTGRRPSITAFAPDGDLADDETSTAAGTAAASDEDDENSGDDEDSEQAEDPQVGKVRDLVKSQSGRCRCTKNAKVRTDVDLGSDNSGTLTSKTTLTQPPSLPPSLPTELSCTRWPATGAGLPHTTPRHTCGEAVLTYMYVFDCGCDC
jgi:hypothetical protein